MNARWKGTLALATLAFAASAPLQAAQPVNRTDPLYVLSWEHNELVGGYSAGRLMRDMDVRGANGEKIGTIENVIIHGDGRASAIVVEAGGFFDIGDVHLRVPWNEVKFDTALRFVTVPVTRESYPRFRLFAKERVRTGPREWRATELLGDYVVLKDGTPYGIVDDFIIGPKGRVEAVVVNVDSPIARGRFAYPYDIRGFDPGSDTYALPYDKGIAAKVRRFDYGKLGVQSVWPRESAGRPR